MKEVNPKVARICERIGLDEKECLIFESALYAASTIPYPYSHNFVQDFLAAMNRRGIISYEDHGWIRDEAEFFVDELVAERRRRIGKWLSSTY